MITAGIRQEVRELVPVRLFVGSSFHSKYKENMMNPCVIPEPPEDIIGDGRWMSMFHPLRIKVKNGNTVYKYNDISFIDFMPTKKSNVVENICYSGLTDNSITVRGNTLLVVIVHEDIASIDPHNRFVQEAKTSESEVLFIGDSIIQQLQFSTLWTEKISALHCLNFGIGGDRVENVLWRVQNGELEFNTKMKAVVLFVGTNNIDCTPHEIFEGILEIIKEIKHRLGNVAIVLPTLLPKGQYPNPLRDRNDHVNLFLLDKFWNEANADEVTENVHVVVIDEQIVGNDQTISHHIMHDYLHLTNSGYTKVFMKVYEKLCELLKIIPANSK